jgi:hypothetical protein
MPGHDCLDNTEPEKVVITGLVPVIHVLTLLDVDGRDVGAKQSFVASPGMTERARFALLPGRLRAPPNFFRRINLIWAVQPYSRKYFRSCPSQISSLIPPSRPTQGAVRDRHGRGAGCDGRRQHA